VSWTPITNWLSKKGVHVLAMAPSDPASLYLATGGGFFKSTDAGGTWNPASSGLTTLNVQSLAIDPRHTNALYCGTWGGGMFAITFVP
jgi:hypothetical protein